MVRCPVHDDRNPSLSIREDSPGHLLVYCHAGCSQADVIEALRELGLWESQQDTLVNLPGIPATWKGADYATRWSYRSADGRVLGYVVRYEQQGGKQVIPFFCRGDGSRAGMLYA